MEELALRAGRRPPTPETVIAWLTIPAIAGADWLVDQNFSLGFLYVIPLIVIAPGMSIPGALALCALCTFLREHFSPFAYEAGAAMRCLMVFSAFGLTALFLRQQCRIQGAAEEFQERLEQEGAARKEGEVRLRAILENSPIGVMVLEPGSQVTLANAAVREMFGFTGEAPGLLEVDRWIPGVLRISSQLTKRPGPALALELPAWRSDGSQLLVRLWASRHQTDEGPILAMAITDISEQSRDAAVSGLENLVAGSRVVLGALSHEIKNLAAAIGAETRQLERAGAPTDHLLGLAQGLEKLASAQLQGLRPRSDIRTDARRVLQEIGAMLSAEFLSERAALHIQAMENPLWVRADYHGLQQVLLNLLTNALRECGRSETDNECRVEILVEPNLTRVRILSPGAPLATEHLFRAFAPDAKGTGLGLYISRSILRSFGGDLRYDETSDRPCFVVELVTAPAPPGPEEAEA